MIFFLGGFLAGLGSAAVVVLVVVVVLVWWPKTERWPE